MFFTQEPRSREPLPAQQLAFYIERQVKPRRLDDAARIALVVLARVVEWRQLLVVVKPATLVQWHRQEMRGKPRGPERRDFSAKTDGIPSLQHEFSAVFITSTGWRQSPRRFCAVVPPKTETPRSRAAGRSRHQPRCRSREGRRRRVAVEDVRNAPASPATSSWPSTSSAVDLALFPVLWWSGDQADKRRYHS